MGASLSGSTSDEILMAAYQAGNKTAFTQLFERHGSSVYGFLARRLGDWALAQDLYQETFLRVHRARQTYDSTHPFRAWLFGIAHNVLADAFRARARAASVAPEASGALGATAPGPRPEDARADGPSPEQQAETRETVESVARALRSLTGDEATVLLLARVEGFSYDDIAQVIGRSTTATKQLAYRALKRVRAELAAAGQVESA